MPLLDSLIYDPAERGALIIVNAPSEFAPAVSLPKGRAALPTLVEAMKMRLVRAGTINAVVPLTTTTINTTPGKANLLGGMRPDDRAKLLFSTFTEEQCTKLGSKEGIGYADLDEGQRSIWDSLFSAQLSLVKSTERPDPKNPNLWNITRVSKSEIKDIRTARLRMNRIVVPGLNPVGNTRETYQGDITHMGVHPGDTTYSLVEKRPDPNTGEESEGELFSTLRQDDDITAFGAKLVVAEPNRLKVGQIDFASAALDKKVDLHWTPRHVKPRLGSEGTELEGDPRYLALPGMGDILTRVAKATGLDIRCDRRIRDTPVWIRGDSARAGDILMALAWGACGAFRKIAPSKEGEPVIWLLTQDIEGIGTRVGRLQEWADDAEKKRQLMMFDAEQKVFRQKPLAHIGMSPATVSIPVMP